MGKIFYCINEWFKRKLPPELRLLTFTHLTIPKHTTFSNTVTAAHYQTVYTERCASFSVLRIISKKSFTLFLRAFEIFRKKKLLASLCLSVCPSLLLPAHNSAATRRIFMKFYIQDLLENLSRKFNFDYNLIRITGSTLHDELCTLTYDKMSLISSQNKKYF